MGTEASERSPKAVLHYPAIWLSQATSRRALLAQIFRLSTAAVGIGVLYRVAAPATVPDSEASHLSYCGSSCYWCGLCGRRCDACHLLGGTVTQCPVGTTISGNAWSKCCGYCSACGLRIYKDCCGSKACLTGWCNRNCPTGLWCSGYVCTVSRYVTACGC